MTNDVRLRTLSTKQTKDYLGVEGELTYDDQKKTVVAHDGTLYGGYPLTRADRPRGWTKREHFTSSGEWTKVGKNDLRRIVVTTHGGGGGGGNQEWSAGGGQGGVGYVILDANDVPQNVRVIVGAGGAADTDGGHTYFGSYIISNGGGGGTNAGTYLPVAGHGGNTTGSHVVDLGGHAGQTGFAYSATANSNFGYGTAPGGGPGGGTVGAGLINATGVRGGGGASGGGTGAPGSVIVEEIYGEY